MRTKSIALFPLTFAFTLHAINLAFTSLENQWVTEAGAFGGECRGDEGRVWLEVAKSEKSLMQRECRFGVA